MVQLFISVMKKVSQGLSFCFNSIDGTTNIIQYNFAK